MEKISDRLKRVRNELGLKQGEFAKKLRISQSMLSGMENGQETISDRNLKLICLEFGVNEEWLKNGGDSPIFRRQELTTDENELLEIYDKLTQENQKNVRIYANERLELQKLHEKSENVEKGVKLA